MKGGQGGGGALKHIFQSVEAQFDVECAEGADARWGEAERRESRVILIGWGLQKRPLQAGFEACCG